MKFTTRQLVTLAVFGALWGALEISLGSILHALKIPLVGAFLAAAGIMVALVGRLFVPRRGSILFIGVIAMILKLFSIGSVVIGPMIAILFEALLAELVLSAFPRPSRPAFLLAGMLAVLWTLLHPFFTGWLLFGRDLFIVWLDLIDEGRRVLGLHQQTIPLVAGLIVASRAVLGLLAGWLAWDTGRLLKNRTAPLQVIDDRVG
jgi:ABC-type thiamin/hydroxymethylpyrimidine transport system permease subunit